MSDQSERLHHLRQRFTPFIETLTRFSAAHHANLFAETEGDDSHYSLHWQSPTGHIREIAVHVSGDHISLVALCWGAEALLARQTWSIPDATPAGLHQALQTAKTWADAVA